MSRSKENLLIGVAGLGLAVIGLYCLQRRTREKRLPGSTESNDESQLTFAALESCIYCDYNATTPIYPEVYQAMNPYLTKCFGNPSSGHVYGQFANQAVIHARKQIANSINAPTADSIYLVSCGTEADNRCVDIAMHNFNLNNSHNNPNLPRDESHLHPSFKPCFITSKIEHVAVLCPLRTLKLIKKEIDLIVLPVDETGVVSLSALEQALNPSVAMVSIMHSNNEIGTIQPIRAIAKIIRRYNKNHNVNILFHTDAAQSMGKVPLDVQSLDVDMMTLVGHKYGAPKGVAALYVKPGVSLVQMLIGGGQERGFRGGTENVPYAVALGEASALAQASTSEYILKTLTLKLRLLKKFQEHLGDQMKFVRYNGPVRSNSIDKIEEDLKMLRIVLKQKNSNSSSNGGGADMVEQLPNTISISFKNLIGNELVAKLANKVACSTGSACHAAPPGGAGTNANKAPVYELSEVLVAIGVENDFGLGTLRLSLGRFSTEEEIDCVARCISEEVQHQWNQKLMKQI